MFRIRKIFDTVLPLNQRAVEEVQGILKDQFPLLAESQVAKIPDYLRNPLTHKFKAILYIAEGGQHSVKGFALMSHDPVLHFCFLDYIASDKKHAGRGFGGVLYDRLREEAVALGAVGIFFECLPDEPQFAPDPALRKENVFRFRFYERYGARPIMNTAYETPLNPDDLYSPKLVFDGLGQAVPPAAKLARKIVRAILERKYGDLCSPEYIDTVVASFRDDPIRLREPLYGKPATVSQNACPQGILQRIRLVTSDRHSIHHVRERGYIEAPVRIDSILHELAKEPYFDRVPPEDFGERHILAVHHREFYEYFRHVCQNLKEEISVYPYVFPVRNRARPPKDLAIRAGYYCLDTFTPINRHAFVAARRAVDCAMTAAQSLVEGFRFAYALVRPPGHHAEPKAFGGFCYFNSAAVAANYLSSIGRVAMLDIDYHHGNGQQEIFYGRSDVYTLSIHGHPRFAYPYFSGFEEETGTGAGTGYNRNFPLPEKVSFEEYLQVVRRALRLIKEFRPDFLVVCLGLDTAKGDPTGTWSLSGADFQTLGRELGTLSYPILIVQEGGYRIRSIGTNAAKFFRGLVEHNGAVHTRSPAI
jgi:acetoin utilization deacetylase AcuC-like enzyme/GNAT superfamily N-acetyltransferase